MDRTLRDRWVLLRYVSQDLKESEKFNSIQCATVKLKTGLHGSAVMPPEGSASISQDASDEMTVNVITLIEGDGFIRTSPVSIGPHDFALA
jgi:hypothetical protein